MTGMQPGDGGRRPSEPTTAPEAKAGNDRPRTNERRGSNDDPARTVRRYLSAIDGEKPGRTSQRTSDTIASRITKVDELMVSSDPLTRLHLMQERIELHGELLRLNQGEGIDRAQLERQFIKVARSYSDRHGLSYAAWRQAGVDADVLDAAGIRRGRSSKATQEKATQEKTTAAPASNGPSPAAATDEGRHARREAPQRPAEAPPGMPTLPAPPTPPPGAAPFPPASEPAPDAWTQPPPGGFEPFPAYQADAYPETEPYAEAYPAGGGVGAEGYPTDYPADPYYPAEPGAAQPQDDSLFGEFSDVPADGRPPYPAFEFEERDGLSDGWRNVDRQRPYRS